MPAQHRLFKAVKGTMDDFFRQYDGEIDEVHLVAFKAVFGGNPRALIKTTTKTPDMGRDPKGVPVVVFLEGKQGMTCLMVVPGYTDEKVNELIENGPYVRKKKHTNVPEFSPISNLLQGGDGSEQQPAAEAIAEVARFEPEPVEQPAEVFDAKPVLPASPPPKRMTPLEKLRANDVEQSEIERLKATAASIIYREVGDNEVPNTLQVPVEKITQAIMEHMRLPPSGRGNFQGIIGNFYSTRISLFALKYDLASEPDSQYTDWLFDCALVLDFVGGKNNLAALTRIRDEEVREREKEEAAVEQNPPPKAGDVEEAVNGGFVAEASLLDLALKTLEGKRRAEEEVRLAEMNASQILGEIETIKTKLMSMETLHRNALALVADAQARVTEYVLSPEIMSKIRAAKARIDDLIEGLGI